GTSTSGPPGARMAITVIASGRGAVIGDQSSEISVRASLRADDVRSLVAHFRSLISDYRSLEPNDAAHRRRTAEEKEDRPRARRGPVDAVAQRARSADRAVESRDRAD